MPLIGLDRWCNYRNGTAGEVDHMQAHEWYLKAEEAKTVMESAAAAGVTRAKEWLKAH